MNRKTVPNEAAVIAKARALRKEGVSWERISQIVGLGADWIRRRIDPGFSGRGRDRQNYIDRHGTSRTGRLTFMGQIKRTEDRPLSDASLRAYRQRLPEDTRDLTARVFGDPLPGRSALDQLAGRAR